MSPDDPRHGENRGYMAHFTEGDGKPCDACRAAHAAYKRSLWRKKYLRRTAALYVDARGTTRRIRALQALGWPLYLIDKELGHGNGKPKGGPNYAHNLTSQTRVHLDTAGKVDAAYRRLSMTPGPSERTRHLARRYGWPPPLAWDDIDDPAEQPKGRSTGPRRLDVDEAVVARILAGERLPANRAEREAVVARWPGTLAELARRTGWKVERYTRRDVA